MVNSIRIFFITLCFSVSFGSASASTSEIENSPLVKRCLGIFEIYKNDDLSSFLSGFHDEWIAIFGETTFKKKLNKKHNKFKEDYNNAPKEILITGIKNIPPHPKEVEKLGVEETKVVSIYIDGVNVSRVDGCKFNRIKKEWYFRDTPL